jgi:hypothetical protein
VPQAAPSKAEAASATPPARAPRKAAATLSRPVAAAPAEAPQAVLHQLALRVAQLESQPAPVPPSELTRLRRDLAEATRKMDGMAQRLSAIEQTSRSSRRGRGVPRSLFATDVYLRHRSSEAR